MAALGKQRPLISLAGLRLLTARSGFCEFHFKADQQERKSQASHLTRYYVFSFCICAPDSIADEIISNASFHAVSTSSLNSLPSSSRKVASSA